jgi:DNA-binding GntR family transcriptional regulator
METLMVRAYELGVPSLQPGDVAAMRAALVSSQVRADAGDLVGALAAIHDLHRVVYAATGNPEFERALGSIGPRFDRILYLWYTESIVDVGSSYRSELVGALERGEPDEAVAIMRAAWARFRGVVAARDDEGEAA